ncbi:MAG: class I SAM-dependent methyltransferase [Clostridia bacterium]|nr:class I SAM-dependent methyltransferase [Clostridia bacterium]
MVAAASVMRLTPLFKARGICTALDYGAGTLRNSKYLLKKGFRVWVLDTEEKLEKYARNSGLPLAGLVEAGEARRCCLEVDLALANFVLNVLGGPKERRAVVENIYWNLRPGGLYLAEVAKKGREPWEGIVHSRELDELIVPIGFLKLKVLDMTTSLAVLYEKVTKM